MVKVLRKMKRSLFWLSAPVWPVARILMGRRRIVWRESDKDKKHIGWLRSDKDIKEFRAHLRTHGFKNHHMAWKDVDEVFSMRKIDQEKFQYHLRFYKNRQITGHYEITPETSAIKHMREVGLEIRKEDFLKIMTEWVA